MSIATEFSVSSNGDVRHDGVSSNNYTVLELHRFLQGLADDASSSGDDDLDITKPNPSERSTDTIISLLNGYNIDDDAAEHFYGGSISQDNGDTVYYGLSVVGSVNSPSTQLQIVQNNTLVNNFWGTGINGADSTILRILVKGRSGGADIDGKRVRVQAREFGDTYDFFNVTLGDGESVAAISTLADPQNDTASGTVSGYNVTNTEGYQTIDLDNGSGPRPYYSRWTYNAEADKLKALWEYSKYITRRGTSSTLYGINGELFLGITHYYTFNSPGGAPFTEAQTLSWSGGTGLLLALDSSGSRAFIQLLSGVAPTNGQTVNNQASTGSHVVSGAVSQPSVPKTFLGSFTGSLIGAFGVGVDPGDLTSSDSLVDLNSVSQSPTSISISVRGVTEGTSVQVISRETAGTVTSGDILGEGLADAAGSFGFNMNYESAFGAGLDVVIRCRNQGFPNSALSASSGGTVFSDQTDANNSTNPGDITLLPVSPSQNDAYYWGHSQEFNQIKIELSQAGGVSVANLEWEYWNGSVWISVQNLLDGTDNYKIQGSNVVYWDSPSGWAKNTVNSANPYYYIRARQKNNVTLPGNQPLGRKVKLDVDRYIPFSQNNSITQNGLDVVAVWIKDTIASF